MKGFQRKILRALREPEKAVSERKPPLCNITKLVQVITSSERTFIVIYTLGQDVLGQRTSRAQRFRHFDWWREVLGGHGDFWPESPISG